MRRAAAFPLAALVAAAASLICAAPALADVAPQPAVAGVVVVALIVLAVIVVAVVVVAVVVLRGIARSRREAELRNERPTERQPAADGEAPPDPPAASEDER